MGSGNLQNPTGRQIDSVGWGLFFIWIGIALVADLGWGPALVGIGTLSLCAQMVRRRWDLAIDGWAVAFGVCVLGVGLLLWLDVELDGSPLPSWLVPGVLVAIGVAILASVWRGRGRS